ncbi:MAG TPA: family 20 glycosylhydrolase, partial [Bacteroidota bacterium]|nr:family 20 glycosylhydrolase [Bacteroidota bacterium]
IAAAKKNHFVVMSPGSHCYFDHYQGSAKYEPLAIGGYTPVEKVYLYEPIPDELSSKQRQYILGAQGNMWTEYVATPDYVEYMIFPRICALAEVVWSPKELRNYSDFRKRLIRHFSLLDMIGINYSKAIYEIQTTIQPLPSADGISVALSSAFDSTGIRYTLDGSQPTPTSLPYQTPIAVTKSSTITVAYFDHGIQRGNICEQEFVISKSTGKPISLKYPPHENYFDQGPFTLVNGVRGDPHHFGKDWIGFQGPNLEATIDLQRPEQISSVTVDLLEAKESWIYYPKSIEVFVGNDTTQLVGVKKIGADEIKKIGNVVELNIGDQTARYVKVIAENAGKIPEGNPGAGDNAWLFVDEIMVK